MIVPTLLRPFTTALVLAIALAGATTAEAQLKRAQPVRPGEPFPAGVFETLNPEGTAPPSIDLAKSLGTRPVVLHYWMVGHERSEAMLLELQKLSAELEPGSLEIFGVAVPRPGAEASVIRQRIHELGVALPVLQDDGFKIGTQLGVRSVPDVTLIDRQGVMRLTNGASLVQGLEYKMDVEAAIRRLAETGDMVTYGFLDPYYPVKEMEGQPCPDFSAPLLTDSVERRYHTLLDDKRLNVLIFWSVDCSHCRKMLPEINSWLEEHPDEINLISAANVTSDAARDKTREFCGVNNFQFRTLLDRDAQIGRLYQVTSTPTILIIGPDGIVDSAITSTHTDFEATIRKKQRQLLASTGS